MEAFWIWVKQTEVCILICRFFLSQHSKRYIANQIIRLLYFFGVELYNDFLLSTENSDDSVEASNRPRPPCQAGDAPLCYMCFDEEDTPENPLITPCKCLGDTRYVHVECLRKWHSAEADNQICFLSSVDATCSVCKSTFKSDFKLRDGRLVKLFKSSLEPPYVSLLVATKHEMAQRLFNTRFQLSFSTLLKPDGRNGTRPQTPGRQMGHTFICGDL
jgi:hypothetical protein